MPNDLHAPISADRSPLPRQYVIDTNVLISDPLAVSRFEEHDIIIPFMVIEELDRIKDSPRKTDVQHEARSAIQCINDIVNGHDKTKIRNGMPIAIDSGKTSLAKGMLRILSHLDVDGSVYSDSVEMKTLNSAPESPDNQILMLVHKLAQAEPEKETILVTKDLNMRLKAKFLGIMVEDYKNEQEIQDVTLMSKGYIHIHGPLTDLLEVYQSRGAELMVDAQSLQDALRRHLDDERFEIHANQAIIEKGGTGAVWFVRVTENGAPSGVITLQCKNEEHLMTNKVFGVKPKDIAQALAIDALLDPSVSLVVISGPAGSGKTLLSVAAALDMVIDKKQFGKIVMTRNTVDIGEPIGFLPGTEEEKMLPWMASLSDTIEALTNFEQNSGGDAYSTSGHQGKLSNAHAKQTTEEMLMRHIQLRSISLMRGRSFGSHLIILDESQNLTRAQFKSLVTRAGAGSKVIVLGNLGQIDARWNGPTSNGLISAVKGFTNFSKSAHIILENGQRSDVATYAEKVL